MKTIISAVVLLATAASISLPAVAKQSIQTPEFDKTVAQQMVQNSIQKFEISEGVSVEDAIASMQLRANMLNFKLVADLPLSEQVKAMGQDANYMRILAFCDALIAEKMVNYDIIFAGFLPCRIAVVEACRRGYR